METDMGRPGGPVVLTGRSRISFRAWLVLKMARFVAPDLSGLDALMQAIKKDRASGPARPGARLLKQINFSDTVIGQDRVFRASPKCGASSRMRILYLHGGAYTLDLQAIQWGLVDGLMKRTKAEIITPIYPLAPEHGWEEAFESVRRTYLGLLEEASPGQVVIAADSAGGGLALGLAQRLRDANQPLPAAMILFSPWLDVGVADPEQVALARQDPALTIPFLRSAGEMWAKALPADDPRVSPLFGDLQGLPPTIVFAGTREVLVSDARRLAALEPKILLREYLGMIHVWPAANFLPEARQALDEAVAFITDQLA